jgi:hypothetical protein
MFVHKQSLAIEGCFIKDNNLGYLSDSPVNDLTTAINICEDISYTEFVYLKEHNKSIYISHSSLYQPVVTRRISKQITDTKIIYRYLVVDSDGKLIKSVPIKITEHKSTLDPNFEYVESTQKNEGFINYAIKEKPKPINPPQPAITFKKISGTVNVPELNVMNEVIVTADVTNLPLGSAILVTITNQDTAYTGNTYLPLNLFVSQGYLFDTNKIAFKVTNNSESATNAFTIAFNVIKF